MNKYSTRNSSLEYPSLLTLACALAIPALFLFVSCGSSATTSESVPGSTVSIATVDEAAVLMLDENLVFAKSEAFTGGPEVYRDEVEGLAALLTTNGVATRVLSEDGLTREKLATFRAVYIVDAFVVMPEVQALLEEYVRGGGVVVGICEVGRHPGSWDMTWAFGRLFGLGQAAVDPWGTGTTWHDSLYRTAVCELDSVPILSELGKKIDFGPGTKNAMAVVSRGARVAASFPRHVVHPTASDATVVEEKIPAVTVNAHGSGYAIFVSALPTNRKLGGWKESADAGKLLANAMLYASNSITLEIKPLASTITVGRNQLGYEPDWPKQVIVRGISGGSFKLRDESGRILLDGDLTRWPSLLWRDSFVVADLSSIRTEGSLKLELSTDVESSTVTVLIERGILEKRLLPTQTEFLRSMRCGDTCHVKDPIRGGHHDATGDWAVRMWSMPHVVYGMTRHLERHPADTAMRNELDWAVSWCLKMQGIDGAAHSSVRPPGDHAGGGTPLSIRPQQDDMQRELEKGYSYNYTVTYAAAMARAARALNSAQARKAAENAWKRLRKDQVTGTADIGNRLWAAIELFNANRDSSLLISARQDAATILARQLDEGHVRGANVFGNYFADARRTTFSPQQWKVFHSIGIYLGLIEYSRILPTDDPFQKEISASLDRFTSGYLLPMSSLTPFGQIASGLEPGSDGLFDVYHFSHQGTWIRNHGLNCDLLAMALVALERDRDKHDPRLRTFALQQINWLLGANPLGYSMVDGLGENVCPMIDDSQGTGRIVGGIANGIIGRGRENLPAWGSSWDSREYWLPHNVYLLATASLLP